MSVAEYTIFREKAIRSGIILYTEPETDPYTYNRQRYIETGIHSYLENMVDAMEMS